MLIPRIFVAIVLPFAGTCAVFAVYMCLVYCAMRARREASMEVKKDSKGLPKSELDKLPVVEASEEELDCSVCLENIEKGQKTRLLPPCRHSFHIPCIDRWLAGNAVCPVCRTSLRPPALPAAPVINGDENC